MSFSTVIVPGAKETMVISIPAVGTLPGANATPEVDLAVASGNVPHTLYSVQVDCSDNPGEDVTLRLYNDAGTPTVGTDHAHVWVPGKRGRVQEYEWPIGIPFDTGLAAAVVKGDGGTGGSDNPSGTVRVTLRVKQTG